MDLLDFAGRKVEVGDYLAFGARSGNHGSMYLAKLLEVRPQEPKEAYNYTTRKWGMTEWSEITILLISSNRRQKMDSFDVQWRAIGLGPEMPTSIAP